MCEFCGCGLYKSVTVILPQQEPLAVGKKAPREGMEGEPVLAAVEAGEECCVPVCGPDTCG